MNTDRPSLDPVQTGRISRATLTEQLEEALRTDILDGVYRPGHRLRASELTERYGVSATPLREALQRLAAENLVELDPRLGATVSPVSEHDLRDIYELLTIVASMALERSVARGDASWDASVLRRFDVMAEQTARVEDPATAADDAARRRAASEAATAHWEFHDALYERCGSPWLLRFVKMLHSHAERYRRLSLQTSKARHLMDEHQAIMLAARNRDPGTAVEALRTHLNLTVQLLVESFGEHSQEPAAAPARP